MSNSSIWPKDRTLLCATTRGQSRSKSDGYEGVLRIPQSSSFTGTSLSDSLMSYPEHLLVAGGGYSSSEMQSVYFTTTADWVP